MASYNRRFIANFAQIASPLYDLLKMGRAFVWGDAHETAFNQLKQSLMSEPILRHFQEGLPLEVQTDASGCRLGAVLVQLEGGKEQVVACASLRLTPQDANCHPSKTECLSVVWSVKKFYPYLYGRQFTIVTDSSALKYLQSKGDLCPKLGRWALELLEYDFTIKHRRRGITNKNADALSRLRLAVTKENREPGNDIGAL